MYFKEIITKYQAEQVFNTLLECYPKLQHKSKEIMELVVKIVETSKKAMDMVTILHVEKEAEDYNVFFTKYRNNTHCYILDFLKEEELVNSKVIQEEIDAVGELVFISQILNFLIENDEEWLYPLNTKEDKGIADNKGSMPDKEVIDTTLTQGKKERASTLGLYCR